MDSNHQPIKISLLFILMLIILVLHPLDTRADSTYTSAGIHNPLLPGYFADPTIKKFGDTYYIYATTDGIKLASGEPQVWMSKDFVNWYNFEMELPMPEGLTNCWAPDLVKGKDGRFYYFMGNCEAGCNIYGYVSDTPVGPWKTVNGGKALIPVGTGKERLPALDAQYLMLGDTALYSFFGTWCTSFGGMGWAKIDPADMFSIVSQGYIPIDQIPMAFEAAYPFKKNEKYLLMYSSGDCRLSSYAVRYAYAGNPTGPYKEGINNPVLVTSEDETIDGPGHHSLLEEDGNYYILYHRHNNPHSTGGEFRQVCADAMYFENDSTIKKIILTHKGTGYPGPNQVPFENMAFQAKVSASSYYHLVSPATRYAGETDFKYLPEYAVDDNNGTLWKAANNLLPQSLTIDLERTVNVRRVMIQFEYPTYYYQYKIEYSKDGEKWKMFADKTGNRRSGCPVTDDNDVVTRFLKITVTGTEMSGLYAAIWNVKVFDNLFETPALQNKEIKTGPGAISTGSLLVNLDIDALADSYVADSISNKGLLGGYFLQSGNIKVTETDSIKAFYFNGESYLHLNKIAPASLDFNSQFTASAWVYNPETGNGECIMVWNTREKMLQSSYAALMYGTAPYGAMAHGDWAVDLPYKHVPESSRWQHIAVTFDGMMEKVYVNGQLNTQLPLTLFVSRSAIMVGASGAPDENFSGYIASARLYDFALSPVEVTRLMNETRPSKTGSKIKKSEK
ncbi:MAG: family 43 glycosylhydrolase [Bacteroidales bacterium]|nr:family 43 glycosylhydrolase [Bacteroidales bacterium]